MGTQTLTQPSASLFFLLCLEIDYWCLMELICISIQIVEVLVVVHPSDFIYFIIVQ